MFFNRILWLVAVIHLSLASMSHSNIETKIHRQDQSSNWVHDAAINNGTGNCMGDDFISCYENILEYVQLGDEAIKISDEKKAVIVIGLTRVGKSTFTQFVANESNPLTVMCKGTSCQLIDDSGDGGDSVVSKTFVPNLIEDEITNGMLTPFYDMPGFDDTRNISVEIANSFFIQKIIKNIEEIKIIVVAKHGGFTSTETSFKNLVTFLMKFIKDPIKYAKSIVLLSNFGFYNDEDVTHFEDIIGYLGSYNESMYGDDSPHPDPNERASVTSWINCFLERSSENPSYLENVAIFRTPVRKDNGTSIRDIENYQYDLSKMKELIWDKTEYIPVSADEVGFTLSTEAEFFLERATTQSATSIRNALTSFANQTSKYLQNMTTSIAASPEPEEMAKLQTHIDTLQNLNLDYCNLDPKSSPRDCIDQLQLQLHDLATEMEDSIFQGINKTTNFLQFNFENIGNDKQYDMTEWVIGFVSAYNDFKSSLQLATTNSAALTATALIGFSNRVTTYLQILTNSTATSPEDEEIEKLQNHINTLQNQTYEYCNSNPESSPTECMDELKQKLGSMITEMSDPIFSEINKTTYFLQFSFTNIGNDKQYDMSEWVTGFAITYNDFKISLERATTQTAGSVKTALVGFANRGTMYLQTLTNSTATCPEEEEIEKLQNHINTLQNQTYEYCNSNPESSPTECMDELKQKLGSMVTEMSDPIFQEINKTTNFLQLGFTNIGNDKQHDMSEWVSGFATTYNDFKISLERATKQSAGSIKTALVDFANRGTTYLQTLTNSTATSPEDEEIEKLQNHINTLQNQTYEYCISNPESSPTECINELKQKLGSMITEMSDPIFSEINKTLNFLQFGFTNIGNDKQYDMSEWVSGFATTYNDFKISLERATKQSAGSIKTALLDFANRGTTYLQTLTNSTATSPENEEIEKLQNHINTLQNQTYEYCISDPESSPTECMDELKHKLSSMVTEMIDPIFSEITKTTNFLQFSFTNIGNDKQYDMSEWVNEFRFMYNELINALDGATIQSAASLRNDLTSFASRGTTYLQDLTNRTAISPDDEGISKLQNHFDTLKEFPPCHCNSDRTTRPYECIEQLGSLLNAMATEMHDPIFQNINKTTNFLQFNFDNFGNNGKYDMTMWVLGFGSTYIEFIKFLEQATTQTATAVKNELTSFAGGAVTYLNQFANRTAMSPVDEEMTKLQTHYNTLQNPGHDYCKSDPNSHPRACVNQLKLQLNPLAIEMTDTIFEDINELTNFLQFNFNNSGNDKRYDMGEWVAGFRSAHVELINYLRSVATNVTTTAITTLKAFSNVAHDHYLDGFDLLANVTIPANVARLDQTIGELLDREFPACTQSNLISAEACLNEIKGKLNMTITVTKSKLDEELQNSVKFLEFFRANLGDIMSLDKWVENLISLKARLESSLEIKEIPERIFVTVLDQLTKLANQTSSDLLGDVGYYQSIGELVLYLSGLKTKVGDISRSLEGYNSRQSLGGYVALVLKEYSELDKNNEISFDGVYHDAVMLLERLKIFPWYSANWTNFHRENLQRTVNLEWTVNEFFNKLYKDLETYQVQAEGTGQLHLWRSQNPILDAANFNTFWTKFKNANINAMSNFDEDREDIKSHIGNIHRSKQWLNILLNYTLTRQASCPTLQSEKAIFNGNYMALSHILDCVKSYSPKPTRVIVLTPNTFFVDAVFEDHGLPGNSKLFIMSRSFYITQAAYINLNGKDGGPQDPKPLPGAPGSNGRDGKNGNDGANGSDFIGVYLTDKGPTSAIDVRSSGGNGQNGQDGGNGADAANTSGPSPGWSSGAILSSTQCEAWKYGKIQMKYYPNSCNEPGEKCDAGDNGVWINICGSKPGEPGYGGTGGSRGLGGHGGFKVFLNVTSSSPTVQTFPNGTDGVSGSSGARGNPGTWGAISVRIDDVQSGGQKECKLMESIRPGHICFKTREAHESNNTDLVAQRQFPLHKADTQHIQLLPRNGEIRSYSLSEFKVHVQSLVSNIGSNFNLFNNQEMSQFLQFVNNNSYLWK